MRSEIKAEKNQPHVVDVHVGGRVRMRRKFLRLSQSQLAEALGMTFQQVQKYERGTNRISASKLYETSRILKVPVAYFFNGYSDKADADEFRSSDSEQAVNQFLTTSEGIELAEAFLRIQNAKHRRRALELVRALGNDDYTSVRSR